MASITSARATARAGVAPLAIILVASALVACASSGVNRGDINLIGLEEEWQLGAQLEQDIARQVRLVDDSAAGGYVTEMGRRLVTQTELGQLPWEFHVVADPAVNAFNIPGGHVYVNTGLIAAARDASELAGVMAHEIAHGVARHGTENLTSQYGLSLVAGLLLGENPATYEQIAAQVLGGGALAKFSRDAEREADELGIRMMYDAGYHPGGMAGIFETLLQQRRSRPNALEKFFASHPVTESRIADARARAAELPPKSGLVTTDRRLDQVKSAVARYNR